MKEIEWWEVFPDLVTKSKQVKRGITQEQKTEVWIYRAKQIHGDSYTYPHFLVNRTTDASTVTCKEHGDFSISPNHLVIAKRGCPSCGTFEAKALKVHKGKYSYAKVNYVNSKAKVTIICPEHGEFMQAPDMHIQGNGCTKCTKKGTLKENFLEDFIATHGTYYDYSKVDYRGAHVKVEIGCPEHGEFMQDPHSHRKGSKCPKCLGTPSDQVYLINVIGTDIYKIGISNDPHRRMQEHSKSLNKSLLMVFSTYSETPRELERHLLDKYHNNPFKGKKELQGYTEYRTLSEEEVNYICMYLGKT